MKFAPLMLKNRALVSRMANIGLRVNKLRIMMKANHQRLINDPIWILRNQIIRLASLLSLAVSVLSISVSSAEKVIISDKTLVA